MNLLSHALHHSVRALELPSRPAPLASTARLSTQARRIAHAVAEAFIPTGQWFEAGGQGTIDRLDQLLTGLPAVQIRTYEALLWALELSTIPRHRAPFSSLPLSVRARLLADRNDQPGATGRNLVHAAMLPIRFAHYNSAAFYERVGCRMRLEPPAHTRLERWHQQVTDGTELHHDLTLDCEVVVVGSGAGGAVVAHELASRGRAVLLLEEGRYFDRRHFDGRSDVAYKKMYRDSGMTIAVGNTWMPVWAGRAVGGSTAINSGTCYRASERVFAHWRRSFGLSEFSEHTMAPYFERVETMLGVGPAQAEHLGGVARVVARGAERLGWQHGPLQRNAPGCDGAGVCAFGCPTGAKRSTDASYVPDALNRGAQLITRAKVESICVKHGRATGVIAKLGSGKRLMVNAQAVVISAGALMTPVLLRQNGLATESGWLGKNLSVHPAGKVVALFDEPINMLDGIPQGYAIEHFAHEGILFEGSSVPPNVLSIGVRSVGEPFARLMESYRHVAVFGFMINDESRGRVLPGPFGSPAIFYRMNARDVRKMQRGFELLSELFLAAGAKRVFPFVVGQHEIRDHEDLERLRSRRLRANQFETTAYHPLGTCRIGSSPKRSCLDPFHQAWHVRALYVVDGSAVPSSLGVNPQLTIMAMALRASQHLDTQLD